MKLACFGAGEKSRILRRTIQEYGSYEIKYFIEDSCFSKIGTRFDDCEVVSVYKMKKLYQENKIDGVLISTAYHKRTVQDMIISCEKQKIPEGHIYLAKYNILGGAKKSAQYCHIRNLCKFSI